MDTRPREERDLAELYPDLDDSSRLEVLISRSKVAPAPIAGPLVLKQATNGYISNTVLQRKALDARAAPPRNRVAKALHKYGFRHHRTAKASPTYIRTPAGASGHYVNYDMDEQDELYLNWYNERNPSVLISGEVFEILISTLELEWYKLSSLMSTVSEPEHHDLTLEYNYDKYGSDDGTGGVESISEQRCAVCNDLECDNSNAIVFCDGCNIAVHQECYGIPFIPEGQWFCRRCMVCKGTSVTCAFCPSKTGAFKQLDNGVWSHVVCALWINEVYFANPVCLEPIEGVDAIPRNRWKLLCYICKQKTGACIQCCNRSCFQAYHVTCAKRAGLYMHMEKGVQGAIASKSTLKSYCSKHMTDSRAREATLQGIHKTRMFFRDSQLLSQKKDRLASVRKQQNRENNLKWKTESNTPIAPQMFVDRLLVKLSELSVAVGETSHRGLRGADDASKRGEYVSANGPVWHDGLKDASAAICRYWCLKREIKRGAPLARIPVPTSRIGVSDHASLARGSADTPYSDRSNAHLPLRNKLAFGRILEQDLERLMAMTLLTIQRQKLFEGRDSELVAMIELAYLPMQVVGRTVVQKMQKMLLNRHEGPAAMVSKGLGDVLSQIEACQLSSSDIQRNIQQIFDAFARADRSNLTAAREVLRALDYWTHVGLAELKSVEANMHRKIPFTNINGIEFQLACYDVKDALLAEDLSEVDEAPLAVAVNKKILRDLLGAR